jgi:hypothetical protein
MLESATGQAALGIALTGGSTRERPQFRGMPMRAERPNEMMKLGAFFHPTGNHVAAWLHRMPRSTPARTSNITQASRRLPSAANSI